MLAALDRFLEAATRRQKDRAIAGIVAKLERALARAFRLQRTEFLERFSTLKPEFGESLREAIGEGDWGQYFTQAEVATLESFLVPLTDAIQAAIVAGGNDVIAQFSFTGSFELAHPRAVAYLREHGAALVSRINDTTRSYIKTVITEGVDQGWSYNKMAKAISSRYEEFAVGMPQKHIASRAHGIAVYEAGSAYEEGNRIIVDDVASMGLEMEHSWLTVGDDRVRPAHAANQDEGWIPLDQDFSSGDSQPPTDLGCRCTALYRRARKEE